MFGCTAITLTGIGGIAGGAADAASGFLSHADTKQANNKPIVINLAFIKIFQKHQLTN